MTADTGPDPRSTSTTSSTGGGAGPGGPGAQPTEEEMRKALEEELKRVTVDDILLQTVVSLINISGRKAGLVPGSEDEKDLDQVEDAIESVRALMPILERKHAEQLGPIRDALARLQMAYAQLRTGQEQGGPGPAGAEPGQGPSGGQETPPVPGQTGPGPAQRSGRLWVPGQD
jgi:hypothetical protein